METKPPDTEIEPSDEDDLRPEYDFDYSRAKPNRFAAREQVIARLQRERAYLAAEFGVTRLGLFGSYASGTVHEASDVDIVVELGRPLGFKFIELAEYLEQVLGRKVDLLTPDGIRNIRVPRLAREIEESIVYV